MSHNDASQIIASHDFKTHYTKTEPLEERKRRRRFYNCNRSYSKTPPDRRIQMLIRAHTHTTCPTEQKRKVEQACILTPQPINYFVNRRHHSLVVSLIGIRIMACWDLYVVMDQPSQLVWHNKQDDKIF
jgi:hypothetical protein